MNGNEIGLLIALIILLLICFFILGYMYAVIRIRRILFKINRPQQRNVKIKKIKVKTPEEFEKMMKNIFDEIEETEEKENDDDIRSDD